MKRDFRTNIMSSFVPTPEPLGEPERVPAVPPPFPKPGNAGVCIVIDTREQTPLRFPDGTETRRGTLHTGDYSILGFEDSFTVERKSMADAVNTVIHDRARFIRELERMRAFAFRRIVITAPFARVAAGGYKHSRANPNSVIGSLAAFEIRFGVPVVFAADADEAARRIADWARHFVRECACGAIGDGGTTPRMGPSKTPSTRHPSPSDCTSVVIPTTPCGGCHDADPAAGCGDAGTNEDEGTVRDGANS